MPAWAEREVADALQALRAVKLRTSHAFSPSSTALRFLSSLAAAAFAGSTWRETRKVSARSARRSNGGRRTRLAHVVGGRRQEEDAVDLNNDGLAGQGAAVRVARQRARAAPRNARRRACRRRSTHRPSRFHGTLSVSLPSSPACGGRRQPSATHAREQAAPDAWRRRRAYRHRNGQLQRVERLRTQLWRGALRRARQDEKLTAPHAQSAGDVAWRAGRASGRRTARAPCAAAPQARPRGSTRLQVLKHDLAAPDANLERLCVQALHPRAELRVQHLGHLGLKHRSRGGGTCAPCAARVHAAGAPHSSAWLVSAQHHAVRHAEALSRRSSAAHTTRRAARCGPLYRLAGYRRNDPLPRPRCSSSNKTRPLAGSDSVCA